MQAQADKQAGVAKRKRAGLRSAFIQAYEQECLRHFDAAAFLEKLGPQTKIACLFCVEGQPEACHRSLVAAKLAHDGGLEVTNIRP